VTEQTPEFDELPEDDGVLDPADSLETDDLASDPLDTGVVASDRAPASERYGVTLAEARAGETLDQRLAQEEPEDADAPDTGRAGRLVSQDEGEDRREGRDVTAASEIFGRDVGIDGGAASAEEAAVHLVGEDAQPDDGES
jgi:hypothetical protein